MVEPMKTVISMFFFAKPLAGFSLIAYLVLISSTF